jgi:hypothetical protein
MIEHIYAHHTVFGLAAKALRVILSTQAMQPFARTRPRKLPALLEIASRTDLQVQQVVVGPRRVGESTA